MGLNVLLESDKKLESDENNPDRFHLSRGLKHHFERLLSPLLYIISRAILFFIWVGVMFWERIIINVIKFFIPLPKSDI